MMRRMGEKRSALELTGRRTAHVDELCAIADRAILLEGEKVNIATAVRRLGLAQGRNEAYNEGLNAAAAILAWLDMIRPTGHLEIQNDGLREIRQACEKVA